MQRGENRRPIPEVGDVSRLQEAVGISAGMKATVL
jgi:hypothetical protein